MCSSEKEKNKMKKKNAICETSWKKSVRNVDRYQFDGTNACETIQTCAVHMIWVCISLLLPWLQFKCIYIADSNWLLEYFLFMPRSSDDNASIQNHFSSKKVLRGFYFFLYFFSFCINEMLLNMLLFIDCLFVDPFLFGGYFYSSFHALRFIWAIIVLKWYILSKKNRFFF